MWVEARHREAMPSADGPHRVSDGPSRSARSARRLELGWGPMRLCRMGEGLEKPSENSKPVAN
jgi:hypothetical protein